MCIFIPLDLSAERMYPPHPKAVTLEKKTKTLKPQLAMQNIAIPTPWKLHTTSETDISNWIATTVILFI